MVAREKALDTDQRDVGSGGDWHLGASDKAWIKSRTDYAIIAAALLLTITWLIPKAQHFIAAIILALLALVASGFQAVASLSKADSRRDV